MLRLPEHLTSEVENHDDNVMWKRCLVSKGDELVWAPLNSAGWNAAYVMLFRPPQRHGFGTDLALHRSFLRPFEWLALGLLASSSSCRSAIPSAHFCWPVTVGI